MLLEELDWHPLTHTCDRASFDVEEGSVAIYHHHNSGRDPYNVYKYGYRGRAAWEGIDPLTAQAILFELTKPASNPNEGDRPCGGT